MNGLSPATVVMVYALASVVAIVATIQLHLVVKVLTGIDLDALALALPGALARLGRWLVVTFPREVARGFLNAVEWTVYGVRHAGL